jgi:hypothetical protein
MHYEDATSGAICVSLREVIDNLEQLWAVVREDLIWVGADEAKIGLVVELNYFDWENASVSDGMFELTFWGCRSSEAGEDLKRLGKLD